MTLEKDQLRAELRRKRARAFARDRDENLGAYDRLALMAKKLISIPRSVVAGYIPMGNEIDPRVLMAQFAKAGAELCLPEVVGKNCPLQFRSWQPGDMLTSGLLNTLQPMDNAKVLVPDLVILPMLGIDEQGVRLGQGGGFYDRTLTLSAFENSYAIGVGFDAQMVDLLPFEQHDHLLDGVITPTICKIWNKDRQVEYLAQA